MLSELERAGDRFARAREIARERDAGRGRRWRDVQRDVVKPYRAAGAELPESAGVRGGARIAAGDRHPRRRGTRQEVHAGDHLPRWPTPRSDDRVETHRRAQLTGVLDLDADNPRRLRAAATIGDAKRGGRRVESGDTARRHRAERKTAATAHLEP